jgi:GAF domain-containing protein
MADKSTLEPDDALAELARIRLADTDLQAILQRIAELAKGALPGADEVSVTLVRDGRPHTAAFTAELALACDERQYDVGYGPCLDAAAGAVTLSLPDMDHDWRWPEYTPRAVEAGVRSSLSIGLPLVEAVTGALNVYARKAYAFDDEAIKLAQAFGHYAAVAAANAHAYDSQATLAQQMKAAMAGRAVIEQAKGIIMRERRCTADEAFAILAKLSQQTNRKLRDVAAALVAGAQDQRGS